MKMQRNLFRLIFAASALFAGFSIPASAKEFNVPEEKPVIAVTFPDSWKPSETDAGVEGQSPDAAVYLSVEATKSEKGMNEILNSTFDLLKEHKVQVDKGSRKENKFTVAGQEAEETVYSGKDEDGPATISITMFTAKDHVVVIVYWATTSEAAKYQPVIAKIVNSVKLK